MPFLTDQQMDYLEPKRRVLQIILGALIAGSMFFMAIVWFIADEAPHWRIEGMDSALPILGLVFAAFSIIAWTVAPLFLRDNTILKSESPTNEDANAALMKIQTKCIIRGALVEGASFFNLIVYLIESNLYNIVAAMVCISLIAVLIPSRNGLAAQIENTFAR